METIGKLVNRNFTTNVRELESLIWSILSGRSIYAGGAQPDPNLRAY